MIILAALFLTVKPFLGAFSSNSRLDVREVKVARLDFFLGGYLPSLSDNYVGMSKVMEKKLPQLYYIKMKISYDLDFIAIGAAMAT